MGKSLQNLAILAVIIIIALAGYFLLNSQMQPASFNEGKEKIAEIWLNNSKEPQQAKAELETLKQEISAKPEGKEKEALLAYLEIQLKVAEGILLNEELGKEIAVFEGVKDSLEESCKSLNVAKEIGNKTERLATLNNELITMSREFAEKFPEFKQEVEKTTQSWPLETSISEAITELEGLCKTGGLA